MTLTTLKSNLDANHVLVNGANLSEYSNQMKLVNDANHVDSNQITHKRYPFIRELNKSILFHDHFSQCFQFATSNFYSNYIYYRDFPPPEGRQTW